MLLTNPKPRSAGANLPKSLIGPTPAYWPIAISRKNTGSPAANNMMMQGIYNKGRDNMC